MGFSMQTCWHRALIPVKERQNQYAYLSLVWCGLTWVVTHYRLHGAGNKHKQMSCEHRIVWCRRCIDRGSLNESKTCRRPKEELRLPEKQRSTPADLSILDLIRKLRAAVSLQSGSILHPERRLMSALSLRMRSILRVQLVWTSEPQVQDRLHEHFCIISRPCPMGNDRKLGVRGLFSGIPYASP